MVSLPLRKKVVTNQAMTQDKSPDSGCTPEAIAMAIDKGSATRATLKEAITSSLQFCFNPANPSLGIFIFSGLYMFSKLKNKL